MNDSFSHEEEPPSRGEKAAASSPTLPDTADKEVFVIESKQEREEEK